MIAPCISANWRIPFNPIIIAPVDQNVANNMVSFRFGLKFSMTILSSPLITRVVTKVQCNFPGNLRSEHKKIHGIPVKFTLP